MWVKSRKVGPGKRQQRWDNGALTMHEREEQRRRRVQALLKQPVEHHLRVIAAIGKAGGRGGASGKGEPCAAGGGGSAARGAFALRAQRRARQVPRCRGQFI